MTQQINKQAILDVLNSLEVIDRQGGEEAYALVRINEENRAKLNAVGITEEMMNQYGDGETFCIYALAFNEKYADELKNWQLIKWGPIDDDFRYRVLNGEGTALDAERLLKLLEPSLSGQEILSENDNMSKTALLEWMYRNGYFSLKAADAIADEMEKGTFNKP